MTNLKIIALFCLFTAFCGVLLRAIPKSRGGESKIIQGTNSKAVADVQPEFACFALLLIATCQKDGRGEQKVTSGKIFPEVTLYQNRPNDRYIFSMSDLILFG